MGTVIVPQLFAGGHWRGKMTNPAKCHCGSISWGRDLDAERYTCASCHRPLWQPIETCPKFDWEKNNFVLVICEVRKNYYQVFQAAFDPIEISKNRFWVPIPDNRKRKPNRGGHRSIQQLLMYTPTHWMPIPEPPK
jgi:hypothetical protein